LDQCGKSLSDFQRACALNWRAARYAMDEAERHSLADLPTGVREKPVRPSHRRPSTHPTKRRHRDPGFRERVLRAHEYRCCVCGFDLHIGRTTAGLEAAHIQWHHAGGPDIEPNGLALCSLHHKLFDLGAFTVEPSEHRVVFSQHAISGGRGMAGTLQFHGQAIHPPQHANLLPAPEFLAWNLKNVFKTPARHGPAVKPRAAR
jgi:putative restriction endonuclease